MKKKIKPLKKLFVTNGMSQCLKELLGDECKIPRAPRKFLRKFIRNARNELSFISFMFKELFYNEFKDDKYVLEVIIEQSDFMEKTLSKIYDDCSGYTRFSSRYRKQIQNQIDSFGRNSLQANMVRVCIINKQILNIALENIYLGNFREVFFKDVAVAEPVCFN